MSAPIKKKPTVAKPAVPVPAKKKPTVAKPVADLLNACHKGVCDVLHELHQTNPEAFFRLREEANKPVADGAMMLDNEGYRCYWDDVEGGWIYSPLYASARFIALLHSPDFKGFEGFDDDESDDTKKKCSICDERSSCGNYDEDRRWVCEDCADNNSEEGFEDCDCGYTHHYEDKCPTGIRRGLYDKWKEDEDDDWMDVYSHGSFKDYCGEHEHLQQFKHFTYYQCWGGGPEGGYIFNPFATKIYRVNRTWGESFTAEEVEGDIEIAPAESMKEPMRIRII